MSPQPVLTRTDPGEWIWLMLLLLAAVCFGIVPVFARALTEAGMAPEAVAFWRFALTALVGLPFLRLGRADRRWTLRGVGAGAAVGLGWIGYVEALEAMPVATAGVIYMTYPLFTLAFAWMLFAQRPGARALAAGGMVLAAAAIAIGPTGLAFGGPGAVAAAFLAPMTFGLAIVVIVGWLVHMPAGARLATVSLGAVVGLAPLVAELPAAAILPGPGGWGTLLGIAVVTALVPQALYVVAAPRVGAARAAMTGSFELPTMFLAGWALFGEALGPGELAAGALVIAAILMTPPVRPPRAE